MPAARNLTVLAVERSVPCPALLGADLPRRPVFFNMYFLMKSNLTCRNKCNQMHASRMLPDWLHCVLGLQNPPEGPRVVLHHALSPCHKYIFSLHVQRALIH